MLSWMWELEFWMLKHQYQFYLFDIGISTYWITDNIPCHCLTNHIVMWTYEPAKLSGASGKDEASLVKGYSMSFRCLSWGKARTFFANLVEERLAWRHENHVAAVSSKQLHHMQHSSMHDKSEQLFPSLGNSDIQKFPIELVLASMANAHKTLYYHRGCLATWAFDWYKKVQNMC